MDDCPVKILLVDDDEDDYIITRDLLSEIKQRKYDLEWVATYDDALEAIGRNQHDGYLVDYRLGERSGMELLREALQNSCEGPMILLTGQGDRDVDMEAMKAGATDYLVKGQLDASMLERSIRFSIERKRSEKELQARYHELQTLQEISETILSLPDLKASLEMILDKAISVGHFDMGNIRLLEPRSQTLEMVASRGYQDPQNAKSHRCTIGQSTEDGGKTQGIRVLKKSRVEEDVSKCDGLRTLKREGVQSAIVVPVQAQDQVLGLIQLGSRSQRKFEPNEVRLLDAFGNHMGIAVQKARLYEQTLSKTKDLSALYSIATVVSQSLDIELVLRNVMYKVLEIFAFDAARIRLLSEDEKTWRILAQEGTEQIPSSTDDSTTEGINAKVLSTGKPIFFEDIKNDPEYMQLSPSKNALKSEFRGSFKLPIRVKEKVIGVMTFLSKKPHRFSPNEIDLIDSIAHHLSIAVENAWFYEQTKKQSAELVKANKVKDEFLSFISHELRTPVSAIIGYTMLTQEGMYGEINADQEKILGKVAARSEELLSLINALLEATKVEDKAVKIASNEVDLVNFLDELRSTYEITADKGSVLNWDYPSNLPVVKTDHEKLKCILQNLINNAIKFTEEGNVTIVARYIQSSNAMEFKIADTGIGISEASLPIIFEKFRQVDGSETRNYGGIGLGLYIVKKFTDVLGGKVDVESRPGKGSIFTVHLPVQSWLQ